MTDDQPQLENSTQYSEINPLKGVQNSIRQRLTSNITNAKRVHFFVDEKVLGELKIQGFDVKQEKFSDLLYDTNNCTLLKKGLWLLLRVYSDKVVWKLKSIDPNSSDELNWSETSNVKNIMTILQKVVGSLPTAENITDYCPRVVLAMEVTRIWFGDEIWVDFCSWLREKAGMFVVGSLKYDKKVSLFPLDYFVAPSKYFAGLFDISKDAFKIAFSPDVQLNSKLFDIFPIINDNNPYETYHHMETLDEIDFI